MNTLYIISYFIYGLCIGSFLNVCIYRLPIGLPISKSRSMCPQCETTLKAIDLVPVFSYLFLKGKCRYCGNKISIRYPLIELLTGIIFSLCYLTFGPSLHSVLMCLFGSLLIVMALIDYDHTIIPDRIHIFIIIIAVISLYTDPLTSITSRLIGAITIGGGMFLISLISKGGIGGGDIKLMAASGLLLGWQLNLLAFFLAYTIAALVVIIPYLTNKLPNNYEVKMGPFFGIALMISALYGNNIITWYMTLL